MTLKLLRKRAKGLGITIEAERDDFGWGYWLIGTGWKDGDFATSHAELDRALDRYAAERTAV